MFLPILDGSCGRVECGLLPVNISNGDGRVELMGVVLYCFVTVVGSFQFKMFSVRQGTQHFTDENKASRK